MASNSRSPFLTRFLSDFTLGFSDGLTVPFALTAGLSSLGRTDTVIYAGLAELCAGCISMGIGGYLAAKDELPASSSSASTSSGSGAQDGDEEELKGMLADGSARGSIDEKSKEAHEDLVRRHLEPLALPGWMVMDIMSTIKERPDGLQSATRQIRSHADELSQDNSTTDQLPVWPVASGLSISLGYVVGGIIPLLPYFFASTIGLGLRWSIAVCLLALMSFGAGKSWLLRSGEEGGASSWMRCLWEGLQMVILGTLAAVASIVCVSLLGGASES